MTKRTDFAKIRCLEQGHWYAATNGPIPTNFVEHDRLYAPTKQGAIASAQAEYPGIDIDTLFVDRKD